MLSGLKSQNKAIGLKQTAKAVKEGRAKVVYLAEDAEERVLRPIRVLCEENGVEIIEAATMRALGDACGIDVGAAAAVVLK